MTQVKGDVNHTDEMEAWKYVVLDASTKQLSFHVGFVFLDVSFEIGVCPYDYSTGM